VGAAVSRLRLATRKSPLALVQARIVGDLLAAASGGSIATELVLVTTAGDRLKEVPLHRVGGQGVFVNEVERAVLEGRADAAVHSAKDLPSSAPGLRIAAVPEREDPRDALVGRRLGELRAGSRVATGSVRRRAQLAWLRPGLTFGELRGNIATRLDRVPEGGAVVTAMAAMLRLGLQDKVAEALTPTLMLPQVGQGALAVCVRPDDEAAAARVALIDHRTSHRALEAERSYLAAVGGGCELPVAAYAVVDDGAGGDGGDGDVNLEAMIASLDGHVLVRDSESGPDGEAVGRELARKLLVDCGGASLLEPVAKPLVDPARAESGA
jgi:hydroxymethylbilane synthase